MSRRRAAVQVWILAASYAAGDSLHPRTQLLCVIEFVDMAASEAAEDVEELLRASGASPSGNIIVTNRCALFCLQTWRRLRRRRKSKRCCGRREPCPAVAASTAGWLALAPALQPH